MNLVDLPGKYKSKQFVLATRHVRTHHSSLVRGVRVGFHHALCRAVRRREFCLLYQPILNLDSHRIVGAEALLRWRRGTVLLSAGDFIEALEDSDLLDTVTEWVLTEACHSAAWIQQALVEQFRIAVNIAPQQLTRGRLMHHVSNILEESGCTPEMLDLEITERTPLDDTASVQIALRGLRDRGIMITIDDFGSGHANFRSLRQFPVTHLKIDRYYCRHTKAHGRALEPIIAAAHRAGIICTGEGIETEAQLNLLKSSDCDEAQGFHIARPMDFHSLVAVLEEQALHDAWSARQVEFA
jgi:EAL domain-containing protein (putative c-di-GMP-specific phosphodiesterase class I)